MTLTVLSLGMVLFAPESGTAQAPSSRQYDLHDPWENDCTVTLTTGDFLTASVTIENQGSTWSISDAPMTLGFDGGLWVEGLDGDGNYFKVENLMDGVISVQLFAENADPSDSENPNSLYCR